MVVTIALGYNEKIKIINWNNKQTINECNLTNPGNPFCFINDKFISYSEKYNKNIEYRHWCSC